MTLAPTEPIIYSHENILNPSKAITPKQPIITIPQQEDSSYHHALECTPKIPYSHTTLPEHIYNSQEMVMKESIPKAKSPL